MVIAADALDDSTMWPHTAVVDASITDISDAELVRLAAAGDHAAFDRLHSNYSNFIERRAAFLFGAQLAGDVSQTVWLWLLTGRWRLDGGMPNGRLYAFLGRLTCYAGWSLLTPASMREVVDDDIMPERVSLEPSPEAQLLAAEREQILAQSFDSLPKYLRRVASLRYDGELCGRDIARRIGVRHTTVPAYFQLIRQHLRDDLAGVYHLRPASRCGHVRFAREVA